MDDLISRQDAIDALEREKTYSTAYKDGYTQTDYFKQYNMGLTDGIKALNKLPSAQKRGEWIPVCRGKQCNCSVCGEGYDHTYEFIEDWNFCPNCGAGMVV